MSKDTLVPIGFTRKPHGLKGEIKVDVKDKYLEDLLSTEVVFLNVKGKSTPFFVENVRMGNAVIAKFEDVNTPEEAQSISGKEMSIREQDLIPEEERELEVEGLEFAYTLGYTIFDKTLGELGVIEDLVEFPQQEMAFIDYQNRETMIPLNKAFIINIDKKAKKVELDLPEGMLDLHA